MASGFGYFYRHNPRFEWLVAFLLLSSFSFAQNLIPNSSFEEYDACPGDFSQSAKEFRVNHWQSANLGTPDYFNDCSIGEADVPHNWAGVSMAHHGKGYTGIYLWMNGENHYREYLQCKLMKALLRDSLYEIEFHFKLSSYSKYAIDRIGLILTDSLIAVKHDQVITTQPTIAIIQDSALTKETGYWETARQMYRAKGGEQFVTIGNFFDNHTTHHYFIRFRPVQQSMLENSAYYYIDDVKITPQFNTPPLTISEDFKYDTMIRDEKYILRNIRFELNRYVLQPSSFPELDRVVNWLKRNQSVNVMLLGHTDDQGSEKYNVTLSKNRAEAVAAYFMLKGIEQRRIECNGYGKSYPLINATTEEAREVNRRVEVQFTENQ